MPSRFPGIDPYLEAQGYWQDFHTTAIVYLRDALGDALPDHYQVRIEERVKLVELIEETSRSIRPDALVLNVGPSSPRPGGAVAVLDIELEPITVPVAILEEIPERHIEITHRSDRKVVTVVEILSPDNKVGTGRDHDLAKRSDLFRGEVHLIEIDYLKGGQRVPMGGPLPPGDAYVIVARWDRRPNCDVYAWSIRRPLPKIRVPLLPTDPDIIFDLAAVYNTTFDRGRYARAIDYAAPLSIGLDPEDRAWAETQARGKVG